MERIVHCIADNVFSPLGFTSMENYSAIKSGRSGLERFEDMGNFHAPFIMSRLDRSVTDALCDELGILCAKYTFFEKMLLCSALQAVRQSGIDTTSERVLFIISSTKGNISLLEDNVQEYDPDRVLLSSSASLVTGFFRNPNLPVVICNACISGVSAQIVAMRALKSGRYDYAVVIGADELSVFILSGFKSLNALSDTPCRPFDEERTGLNLGECAATVILKASDTDDRKGWELRSGIVRNDAYHISSPSRTAQGSYMALTEVLKHCSREQLSFLSLHGTATGYNDEMESVAIHRAGLSDVPATGLKGYLGHTLGAAGIVETILSMYAVMDGTVLATRGFGISGVSYPVNVSSYNRPSKGNSFIKMISGFGGGNAALLCVYNN